MSSPTPQGDVLDPPFWVDFDFNLKYIFTTILLHFGIVFGVDFTSQAQWRIHNFAVFWIFLAVLCLGGTPPPPDPPAPSFFEVVFALVPVERAVKT